MNLSKQDIELFDDELFLQSISDSNKPLPLYKAALKKGLEVLEQRFKMGIAVDILVRQQAWLIDQLLIISWKAHDLDQPGFALVAGGGYGRGELHPASDVDIAIIFDKEPDTDIQEKLSAYLTFLWDIGLEVGHSVRTVDDCVTEARDDITVATNIMETRLLEGDESTFEQMQKRTSPDHIWPNRDFFAAKLEEQIQRHKKFRDSAHNLEPNIKEGPGGLRDIQTIGWAIKRYFGADTLAELVKHDFLTEEEFHTLDAGQSFLWRIRYILHLITGRREDRLLFEHQRQVAIEFGFTSHEEQHLGVEQFMKMYYCTITELSRLNEMLLSLFEEALLLTPEEEAVKPLNSRFQIRNHFIEVTRPSVFKQYPFAMLEIFLLLQQHPEIKGVRASTIRNIRDNLYLIDDEFRDDLRCKSLFMEIMRQPRHLGIELQRMLRYGILAAYLPSFEAISGLMQFDLFHIYTVDEHTLTVVRNLRRFSLPETIEKFPLCAQVYNEIAKPELLFLAGLFHDIAKGRGGDHAELGAVDATEFCVKHGLGQYDTNLVSWLVKNHLRMSSTAQRKDLSDIDEITAYAELVGDKTHLDYLYLLTVADIRGTNPKLWNGWKDSLLKELYRKTLKVLNRGIENPVLNNERVAEAQGQVLALLCSTKLSRDNILEHWNDLDDEYFLRHSPDEIAWHTESIIGLSDDDLPLIKIRPESLRGGSEIFIYCQDRDSLFAAMTAALDRMGLSVLDARIFTSADGFNFDTYTVLETATNDVIKDQQRTERICAALGEYILSPVLMLDNNDRKQTRQLKSFELPASVSFSNNTSSGKTIMEVTATDQPGLLAMIGTAMTFCGVRLHNAKVATYGERVEDIFHITDMENNPITEPVKFECLERTILDALNTVHKPT